MKLSICLVITLITLAIAQAADLNPPDWRGKKRSTFQQWEFQFNEDTPLAMSATDCSLLNFIQTTQGQQTMPDLMDNPYVKTTGICVEFKSLWFITKKLDWLRSFNGRDGIWKLERKSSFENFLNFIIPNAAVNENTSTIVQLQIIYYSLRGTPEITIQFPSNNNSKDTYLSPVTVSPETILPGEWKHTLLTFVATGCPRYESIFIYPPEISDLYIDSVSIDTICTDNDDAILSM